MSKPTEAGGSQESNQFITHSIEGVGDMYVKIKIFSRKTEKNEETEPRAEAVFHHT